MAETSEQQIQKLQEEYQRKLNAIQEGIPEAPEDKPDNAEKDRILAEHQALSEATEGMIQAEVPGFEASSHEPEHTVSELPEEKQAQVRGWVSVAHSNLSKAIQSAKDSGDIGLIDAFHGALTADKTFADMVKNGALKQLAA